MGATKTILGVELMHAGTWGASSGVATVTAEHIKAMVDAYADPGVDRAVLKIGHTDPRFNSPEHDGSPALGWIENVHASDDGRTLIGDLVGVPAKLAEIIPSAYRRRSVEIRWGLKTNAGKHHVAVLTALALLGSSAPAVKGLADVAALYGAAPAADFTDASTFLPVVVPELAGEVSRYAMGDTGALPPADPAPAEPATAPTNPKENPVPVLDKAAVTAALEAAGDADVEGILKGLLEPAAPADPAADPAPADPAPADPAAAPAVPETVTLSAASFAELTAGATAGQASAVELAGQRRDRVLTSALSEGRILPAEEAAWRTALEANEAGTTTLLSGLTPRLAVVAVGHESLAHLSAADEDKAWDAYSQATYSDLATPKG